ncbi:hypothetical protein IEQ34_005587 [Dendrobium chrysotoxum]|uniref:Uncharacterized protein n=1 Tax=Dendrobium chrysotoxum TaxID=161865 RepID=A0AAV7HCN2_DENCH|nr:hypothetical protein IEQ34_005587 [Dendrobium chrysotoxum]
MKKRASVGLIVFLMALVVLASVTMKIQYDHLKVTERIRPRELMQKQFKTSIAALPRGIVESTTDMEMKSLWNVSNLKDSNVNFSGLLAIAVGISQKRNVDSMVRKFLADYCSIILFHYDGNVNGWQDLGWTDKAIHILAQNQTKWFAKRFLHPDVVALYDYIFLWDEDIGVDYFNPGRYMQIIFSEGLEISQPAVDPEFSSDIHHRITVRNRKTKVHRRVYFCGSVNCSNESKGPPCTGWVEGMVPVFSKSAWRCVWHLIQNDLIHGWGLDMKLGYCAQGDRTKNVGVIDTEFIIHQGIPLDCHVIAGSCICQGCVPFTDVACYLLSWHAEEATAQKSLDSRSRIRRQSTAELEKFKERWNKAVEEDRDWIDPFDLQKR